MENEYHFVAIIDIQQIQYHLGCEKCHKLDFIVSCPCQLKLMQFISTINLQVPVEAILKFDFIPTLLHQLQF